MMSFSGVPIMIKDFSTPRFKSPNDSVSAGSFPLTNPTSFCLFSNTFVSCSRRSYVKSGMTSKKKKEKKTKRR